MKCEYIFILASLMCGCTMHYSKIATPAPPESSSHYRVLNHIKKEKSGIRFFTLGGSAPSAMHIMNAVVQEEGGDGIINTEVSFREMFIGPISIPYVLVEGDVVRVVSQTDFYQNSIINTSPNSNSGLDSSKSNVIGRSFSQNASFTASNKKVNSFETSLLGAHKNPDALAPKHDTTTCTLATWKAFYISIENDPKVYNDWSLYLIRTQQKENYKKWIANLTEQDFEKYKKGNLAAIEWLLDHLTIKGDELEAERIKKKDIRPD